MKLHAMFAAIAIAVSATLAGCSAPSPSQYAAESPKLDIQRYFNGALEAHGMFQDRSGAVIKRFVVTMQSHWTGNTGILDEQFVYADGTRQQRVWTLTKAADGSFSATAPDVIGVARGTVSGNALRWQYVLALPVDGKVINVDMDDWMFLIDDRVILNRTQMSKYGVNLGNVTLAISKRP